MLHDLSAILTAAHVLVRKERKECVNAIQCVIAPWTDQSQCSLRFVHTQINYHRIAPNIQLQNIFPAFVYFYLNFVYGDFSNNVFPHSMMRKNSKIFQSFDDFQQYLLAFVFVRVSLDDVCAGVGDTVTSIRESIKESKSLYNAGKNTCVALGAFNDTFFVAYF